MPQRHPAAKAPACAAPAKVSRRVRDNPVEEGRWALRDALGAHRYDYRTKGAKPDDPGWHACTCGWEGYWCEFEPHLAQEALDALRAVPGLLAHLAARHAAEVSPTTEQEH